jgi:uncharacterized membrane protein SpoIIM required for sporulation
MAGILFSITKAKKHPIKILLITFLYTTVSILISSWIFPQSASLIAIFLTIFPSFYLIQNALKIEEQKEAYSKEKKLLREHKKILTLFLMLFLGIVLAFAIWTYILPVESSAQLFSTQQSVLTGIQNQITGNAIEIGNGLNIILINNLKVLFLSLILSLIYGAGAIFVLAWNASIMGYIIGGIVKANGAHYFPAALLKYFIHGLPEMMAYFIAILIGGILYFCFINGDFRDKIKIKKISLDAFILIISAIMLIIISALLEVYISPII